MKISSKFNFCCENCEKKVAIAVIYVRVSDSGKMIAGAVLF